MKESYKLSKTNIIISIIFIVFIIAGYILSKSINTYGVAYLLGGIVGTFIFPFLISLITWFISKRNNKYGNIAFTVVMVLMILSKITQFFSPN